NRNPTWCDTDGLDFVLQCLNRKGALRRSGQWNSAVLVPVGEFVQMSQGALVALPCVKRLQTLDDCLRFSADTVQEGWLAARLVSGQRLENRELRFVRGRRGTRFLDDELPDQMVERRSEVVNDFANDDAPHGVDGMPLFDHAVNLQRVRVHL